MWQRYAKSKVIAALENTTLPFSALKTMAALFLDSYASLADLINSFKRSYSVLRDEYVVQIMSICLSDVVWLTFLTGMIAADRLSPLSSVPGSINVSREN